MSIKKGLPEECFVFLKFKFYSKNPSNRQKNPVLKSQDNRFLPNIADLFEI